MECLSLSSSTAWTKSSYFPGTPAAASVPSGRGCCWCPRHKQAKFSPSRARRRWRRLLRRGRISSSSSSTLDQQQSTGEKLAWRCEFITRWQMEDYWIMDAFLATPALTRAEEQFVQFDFNPSRGEERTSRGSKKDTGISRDAIDDKGVSIPS